MGYHSCDRSLGLSVLNGENDLDQSTNPWDWLGPGIYFWENDPNRALTYAEENAAGKQFNKKKIKNPFVLGAIIDLGECLNLVESVSLEILTEAYDGLKSVYKKYDQKMPVNKGNNRALDCAVIKYIHESNKEQDKDPYQTVRAAFIEGELAYPGANFSSRQHIQIAVLDPKVIKGYFLPRDLNMK